MRTFVEDPNAVGTGTTPGIIAWTLADIVQATSGRVLQEAEGAVFSGPSIDSRTIDADQFFVALPGIHHDGHRFTPQVLAKGCRGLVVQDDRLGSLPPQALDSRRATLVAVRDTHRALGDLAHYHRLRSGVGVVAVTGTNGKTTTKEMTAAVLGQAFATLKTRGNRNNHVGLPLTLLEVTGAHRWAVLEMGMNHPGEIRRLTEICSPDVGVITNIGPAHLAGVGSLEGVMAAKAELLETMREGWAVLNADDPRVMRIGSAFKGKSILFGTAGPAQVRALSVDQTEDGTRFTLALPHGQIAVRLSLHGRYMVSNALAAAATGYCLGMDPERIRTGLESCGQGPGRMHLVHLTGGIRLLDDSYNANPASVSAAIETLACLKKSARAVLVLGDMRELGEHAASAHREMGRLAAARGIDTLLATGDYAEFLAEGAREGGMPPGGVVTGDRDALPALIEGRLGPGDWVLVKGSRSVGMEVVVRRLKEVFGTDPGMGEEPR